MASELDRIRRAYKKHLRYANKLKEGGKAWEKEMEICHQLQKRGMELYQQCQNQKYGV